MSHKTTGPSSAVMPNRDLATLTHRNSPAGESIDASLPSSTPLPPELVINVAAFAMPKPSRLLPTFTYAFVFQHGLLSGAYPTASRFQWRHQAVVERELPKSYSPVSDSGAQAIAKRPESEPRTQGDSESKRPQIKHDSRPLWLIYELNYKRVSQ